MKRAALKTGLLSLALALAVGAPAASACPQDQIAAFVRELSEMSAKAEKSVRYLVPRFRECGQGVIASELDGTPEWLLSMRQHLQAQAGNPAELKTTIETALGNLNKAEASLRKNYEIVLQGIDSMYDTRFPPKCRRERSEIVSNMKSTRPLVPSAIQKLAGFKSCLGI